MGDRVRVFLAISTDVSNLFFFDAVFNYRSQYWIWSPILGSFCGGIAACFIYDVLIYLGPESPINAPYVMTFFAAYFPELTVVHAGMQMPVVTSRKAKMGRVGSLRTPRALRQFEMSKCFSFLRDGVLFSAFVGSVMGFTGIWNRWYSILNASMTSSHSPVPAALTLLPVR